MQLQNSCGPAGFVIIEAVSMPSVLEGRRQIRVDAIGIRPTPAYRSILEIFVPSMLTPAINPCWLKINA